MDLVQCLLFVRQALAEQTPQPSCLPSLQRDSDARVSVSNIGIAKAVERQEHRIRAFWAIDRWWSTRGDVDAFHAVQDYARAGSLHDPGSSAGLDSLQAYRGAYAGVTRTH